MRYAFNSNTHLSIFKVKRRTELETLKSRQDQLLLSVIPAYLTDKVSQSIIASSSAAASMCKQNKHQKLFHELHVQVHDNVRLVVASWFKGRNNFLSNKILLTGIFVLSSFLFC
jgi:hypothetical protein